MSTPQEQVQCVLWQAQLQSLSAVQRRFRTQYGRRLARESIRFWDNKLRTAVSLLHIKSPGKTRTSEGNANHIREALQRSPRKSVRADSLQLQIPRSSVHDVLHKGLRLRPYKIQIIRALKSHNLRCGHARKNWRVTRFFPPSLLLGRGDVPCQWSCTQVQLQVWGSQNPHVTCELERGSSKVNVWAGLMHKLIGRFFLSKNTVTGHSYLGMLELYALPQLPSQTIL
jgi:hypothetical protein